jgi:hypothetical protein
MNFSLLRTYQRRFRAYAMEVIQEGVIADEIKSPAFRGALSGCAMGCALGADSVSGSNDESEGFEATTKAIEDLHAGAAGADGRKMCWIAHLRR